jgi:hypothetical protein
MSTTKMIKTARTMGMALALASLQACASGSGGSTIGDILGGVLGGGAGAGGSQVSGTIQGVDTRYRTIGLTQSNGSTVSIGYDDNTKVVYNNQSYGVTSLERGDQVTARVQASNNNSYYTDLVQVDRPVQGSGTVAGNSENVVSIQGTVRGVDQTNGLFALDATNGTRLTVSLPYNVTRNDQTRFQNLRNGDSVRLYGVYLNNSRVELRQFY